MMSTSTPTPTPPCASGTPYHQQHHQQQQQQRTHYHNNYSSQSLSSTNPSLSSGRSLPLRENGGQTSPLAPAAVEVGPPLPQRPQRHHHEQRAPSLAPHHHRDTYYCWSDGSGSTRLPQLDDDGVQNIRLHHYNRPTIVRSKGNHKNRRAKGDGRQGGSLGTVPTVATVKRPPIATAVVYPTIGYYPGAGAGAGASAQVLVHQTTGGAHNVLLTSTTTSSSSPCTGAGAGAGAGGVGTAAASGSRGYVARGCGGRCETCENVCYYLLQVAFAMGVLIGTSLCIAGAALRRSPGRQLQVLLYIGALVAIVSALLLVVQCRARRQAYNHTTHYHHQQYHDNIPMVLTTMTQQPLPAGDGDGDGDVPMQQQTKPRTSVNMSYNSGRGNKQLHQYVYVQAPQQQQQRQPFTTIQRGVPVTILEHVQGSRRQWRK